ncbi:hypothetical protein DFA_09331 [Cavenderia fasciculata]|uniref:Uncharacterized protein n=1 Tax=Cavenderia fasciculata TaxID=261658 RepID=F4Q7B9_CACFS|nr:uncharacterized protein DFA_09331 [Cavenderia fasciculata]EGG16301.1 hypothetical protein DFA_09331 [Cavenderia fasciculata]|eukprot:XP_004354685.1 hypothetical protein DFA_09331 [Cavenderia fasciculata]
MFTKIIFFLLLIVFVSGDSIILYKNSDGNQFGRCITGSKNGEEIVEIETKNNSFFQCTLVASSNTNESIECEQISAPAGGSQEQCKNLKSVCGNTYYGQWNQDSICSTLSASVKVNA